MTIILGISAFYHDSAAALIIDGEIISAVQEERFSRIKNDNSYPEKSIEYILDNSNITMKDVDYVIFYDKPFNKFDRLIETFIAYAPNGFLAFKKIMPLWLKEKLFQKYFLLKKLSQNIEHKFDDKKLLFSEHHLSHAASAFFVSSFKESLILTIDGVGEWSTTTVAIGKDNNIKIEKEIHFPHSIGLLYSAFTYYLGFKVNSGEYKVMGLAPYGDPIYVDIIKSNLIDIKDDGSFRLDTKYFGYTNKLNMLSKNFIELFKHPIRKPDSDNIEKFHMDMAASVQSIVEEVLIKMCTSLFTEYKISNLCLAGGVALNSVAIGKLKRNNIFKNIWVQPAAGDAGGSIGAALAAYYMHLGNKRKIFYPDGMKGSYLGPKYSNQIIEKKLSDLNTVFDYYEDDRLYKEVAKLISSGHIVAWFQGAMEFGPRALGNRSILADPRNKDMQKNLNLKIKYRESFRPFAPSILYEHVDNWYEGSNYSPYMSLVSYIKEEHRLKIEEDLNFINGFEKLNIKRSKVTAVTHVDYSSRIQTVEKNINSKFHMLISEFNKITNCPILLNTSFNIRGEPIVMTVEDAYKCFMKTEISVLICGNYLLYKNKQSKI